MHGYTPIFSKIVDSSLWDEPDFVVKIFISMLAKKDRDNVVRATAFNISRWARKSEEEVIEALRILSSPDTKRLEPQEFEGRRIEKVKDGWIILKGEFYQKLMMEVNMRAYKRDKQREYRSPEYAKSKPETQPTQRFQKPTIQQLVDSGMPREEAQKFLNHYDSCGWTVGKNKPMKDWQASARGWMSRNGNFNNSNNGSIQSTGKIIPKEPKGGKSYSEMTPEEKAWMDEVAS